MGNQLSKVGRMFFISLVSLFFLTSGVFAFYLFSFDKSINYEVVGAKKDLIVSLDFSSQVLFNVSENLTNLQSFELTNENGPTEMNYLLDVEVDNLDSFNCDSEGDISFKLRHFPTGPGEIDNGTSFNLIKILKKFNFTITTVSNRVCPQNITVDLSFLEV